MPAPKTNQRLYSQTFYLTPCETTRHHHLDHHAVHLFLPRPCRRLRPHICNSSPRARPLRCRSNRLRRLRHLLQHRKHLFTLRANLRWRNTVLLLRLRRPRHLLRRESAANSRSQLRRLLPRRPTRLRVRWPHFFQMRPGWFDQLWSHGCWYSVCQWPDCCLQWRVWHQYPTHGIKHRCDPHHTHDPRRFQYHF